MPVIAGLALLGPAPTARAVEAAAELLHWAAEGHRVHVIGEVHGTREIPAMTGELAALLAADAPLLVALEIEEAEQVRIDAFLDSEGDAAARSALLAGDFWNRDRQDGRSSEAMFALLDRLRALRGAGNTVKVIAFDAALGEADDREARSAERIRQAYLAADGNVLVVVAGNYRASTAAAPAADSQVRFLGWHLRDLRPFSVDVTAWQGDYWTCDRGVDSTCGRRELINDEPSRDGPLLHMDAETRARGFSAQLILERISASPPARR
ncbi:MAG TPA: hypothetical protein PKZ76_02100 [Xanthomonadaceae bacterium]|nr:hypothetical protein [Xanthomonadaceae bacterium]